MTHPDSPIGKDDTENVEIRRWGEIPEFSFEPQRPRRARRAPGHHRLRRRARRRRGASSTSCAATRCCWSSGLIRYAMDILIELGYEPTITPDLARDEALVGTGFIPRGPETQIYSVEDSDLSLIATAEITLAGSAHGRDRRRRQAPPPLRRPLPLLPHGGRLPRPREPRPLPRPPVHQGRDVRLHHPGPERERPRGDGRDRGAHLPGPRPPLPRRGHLHRRPRRRRLPQVRPRSLDAGPKRLRRGNQHLQHHRLPGPPAAGSATARTEAAPNSSTPSTAPPSP